jgi:DNA-directed RNA polymerase subunit H (RpoH/RPB5)
MDIEIIDLVIRTKPTILEILENRGYNVEAHKNTSPEKIMKLATVSSQLLNFNVSKPPTEGSEEPAMTCHIIYAVDGPIRLRVENFLNNIWKPEDDEDAHLDPEKNELFIVLSEPYHDVFNIQSAKMWGRMKARVSFFHIKNLVSNPAHHSMVPPHRKLSEEEVADLIVRLKLRSKFELERITYDDIQARVLGLVPGDIVEIRRPSPTSGTYIKYRVCSLT